MSLFSISLYCSFDNISKPAQIDDAVPKHVADVTTAKHRGNETKQPAQINETVAKNPKYQFYSF